MTGNNTMGHVRSEYAGDMEMDEYYAAYDYPDTTNNTGYEPGVIPDPGLSVTRQQIEPEEVVLPDDSLADTDLHDHDLIDSVMYIYFGSSSHTEGGTGKQILIVGAAISLVAQFLSLTTALRRLRSNPHDPATFIFINTELSLFTSNLIFMLGVQATGKQHWCEGVALLLHYLHLVACCWLFSIGVLAYRRLTEGPRHSGLRLHCTLAWLLPASIVTMCYALNPHGYETHRYCWMSVVRGMLLSYMVPVASLILNWLLYLCSSMVLPPLLVLEEEQRDRKMSDTEPLLSSDTTPVHAPSPTCLVTATANGGELLELRLDSISTISS
ncbi:adhesion G-protein coupled receptor D2 isoform X2 [Cryptotermes secundus]|uniref:adhesion G-protein coupled receptor D2 isoform X2 n=1 Tax=Cryptotermes secundus TaxID=105785 RepID=UPI000CD7B53E|nr:adhesion G-protein coupled receptor D2 isoform X2 [Cryptotermes secundus]